MGMRFNTENIDNIFRSIFCIMKYFYEKSGNNTFEKKEVGFSFFKNKIYIPYDDYIKYLNKGFNFIYKVLDLYLNSEFYDSEQKRLLSKFKNDINKQEMIKLNKT